MLHVCRSNIDSGKFLWRILSKSWQFSASLNSSDTLKHVHTYKIRFIFLEIVYAKPIIFFLKKGEFFRVIREKLSKMTNVQKRVLTINREYVSYLRSSFRSVLQSLPLLILLFSFFIFICWTEHEQQNKTNNDNGKEIRVFKR